MLWTFFPRFFQQSHLQARTSPQKIYSLGSKRIQLMKDVGVSENAVLWIPTRHKMCAMNFVGHDRSDFLCCQPTIQEYSRKWPHVAPSSRINSCWWSWTYVFVSNCRATGIFSKKHCLTNLGHIDTQLFNFFFLWTNVYAVAYLKAEDGPGDAVSSWAFTFEFKTNRKYVAQSVVPREPRLLQVNFFMVELNIWVCLLLERYQKSLAERSNPPLVDELKF